jgi:enterobactin synthetase component D
MPSTLPNPPLFPPFVAQHTLTFDVADGAPLDVQFPEIALPVSLARAARKRQGDFLAGRFCARAAMKLCAPEHADIAVAVGPNREPLWPAGVIGSITHTGDIASAAVARSRDARSIGLDVERIMTDEEASKVRHPIADQDEIAKILDATGWRAGTAITAVFSAKETIFKALYPEVQRYFDFRDAYVDELDTRAGTFRAHLTTRLTDALQMGHAICGRFALEEKLVWTAVVLPH